MPLETFATKGAIVTWTVVLGFHMAANFPFSVSAIELHAAFFTLKELKVWSYKEITPEFIIHFVFS